MAGEAFKLPLDNAIGFHTNAAEFLFQPEVVKDRQDQNDYGGDNHKSKIQRQKTLNYPPC